MFWNWVFHKNVEKLDIAHWINGYQKKIFWRKARHFTGFK
jgi:hypothetical protein